MLRGLRAETTIWKEEWDEEHLQTREITCQKEDNEENEKNI